jgi:hypothetical protein
MKHTLLFLLLTVALVSCKSDQVEDQIEPSTEVSNDDIVNDKLPDVGNDSFGAITGDEPQESKENGMKPPRPTDDINLPVEAIEEEEVEEDMTFEVRTEELPIKEEAKSNYDFHAYERYDAFLRKYVSSQGNVNYASIKANKSEFDAIVKEFNAQYPESNWSKNEVLAFWINTYNLFTIKLIVDNYPTSSITGIASKPWDIKCVKLKSHTYSLDQVENSIIRKQFNEPRIHFALNCASESCPILMNSAYKASSLNSQLTRQTKLFLADGSKNSFDKKEITISPIFDWYKVDFTKNGTVIDFINKYRDPDIKGNVKISYGEYSWKLNK